MFVLPLTKFEHNKKEYKVGRIYEVSDSVGNKLLKNGSVKQVNGFKTVKPKFETELRTREEE